MMRSMFSAVSGLRAHQTRMDVIGNNIANVNTVGFKGTRVTFQEVFSQTIKGAGAPQLGKGGTNAQQVGLGINIASMDTFHMRGAVETTNSNTDLMINGDGFFMVSDDVNFLNRSYTRAGNFNLDQDGNLVTADGLRVLGYMADANGVLKSSLEGLQISKAVTFDAKVTSGVKFEGNLQSETKVYTNTDAIATNLYNPNDTTTHNFVYHQVPNTTGTGVKYVINPTYENTVARETSFEVYDALGGIHQIKQAFIKIPGEAGNPTATPPVLPTSKFRVETFYVNKDGSMVPATTNSTLSFQDGKWLSGSNIYKVDAAATNGAGEFSFTVDYSKMTMFSNTSTASATGKDGYKQGTLDDFSISPTGEVLAMFDNGNARVIGQIALANFKNPAGLEKTSSNNYRITSNSGEAIIGVPGSGGFGALNPGAIEMSNVDLSREFTNMITTQRGFQANSRIITTSDEMLQELVNMKR